MDSQSALGRMEKWRERKEALPEYEQVKKAFFIVGVVFRV